MQRRRVRRLPGCSKTRSSSRVSTSCSRSQLTYTPTRRLEANADDASSRCTIKRPARGRAAQHFVRSVKRLLCALSSSSAVLQMARSVARIARRAASLCARSSAARGSTTAAQRVSLARRCAGCAAMRVRLASATPRIANFGVCAAPSLYERRAPTATRQRCARHARVRSHTRRRGSTGSTHLGSGRLCSRQGPGERVCGRDKLATTVPLTRSLPNLVAAG